MFPASCVKRPFGIANNIFRAMSVYPSHYQHPIVSKNKQKELISVGSNKFALRKPPTNCVSNSIFYDDIVTQFTNYVLKQGNKKRARQLVEKCFENIKRVQLERYHIENNENVILDVEEILSKAVTNCKPVLLLTQIKRGGVSYRVPIPATNKQSFFLSMKWLLESAREKERNVPLPTKLAWEILDAANEKGSVMKKKLNLYKLCQENRAYAHYRWS